MTTYHVHGPSSSTGLIHKKIAEIMRSLGAIEKNRKNAAQGYNFRGIDDVYNELHDHLAEHGVFTVPRVLKERTEDRTTNKGSSIIYRVLEMQYTFYAEDGSYITAVVIGEGMDSGDKASNKAMAVAHKYALMQIFAIPTAEAKDPEVESHELKPAPKIFHRTDEVLRSRVVERLLADGLNPEQVEQALVMLENSDLNLTYKRVVHVMRASFKSPTP